MAALNLATRSAGTRRRSFTSVPCALAHSRTAVGFSPLTDALHPGWGWPPAAAWPPGGSHAACPAVRPISDPVPSSPTRTARFGLTAIKVIDQQNLCLLGHTCLFLSPAWRWRISLARSNA